MKKIYYDEDADLGYLAGKRVGIIGYGIQGHAHALNIRDSGIDVLIANRRDRYAKQAMKDGFKIYKVDRLVSISDVILLLIPDQVQNEVYEKYIKNSIRPNCMLVFAHGYALSYSPIKISSSIDIGMLAPRMPGYHIREYFLKGGGVPAFADIVQNRTSFGWKRLLALAKAAGFTRAGVLKVNYKVEADLDLFTEQFLVATLVRTIHTGFKVLVEEFGYPPVPTLMELYASGELAQVLRLAADMGIGKVFQKNASPTCQYGIAANRNTVLAGKKAREIIRNIRSGRFARKLDKEGKAGYPKVHKLWKNINRKKLVEAQEWINNSFKWIKDDFTVTK